MTKILWLVLFVLAIPKDLRGQAFEISGIQDTYKGMIGQTIKATVAIRNITEKPVTVVIRRMEAKIGGTQKNYFCLNNDCLDQGVEEYIVKIEPQTVHELQVALDAGLAHGTSLVKYIAYSTSNPLESHEFELNFSVEEFAEKENIYKSSYLTLYNVYPNPVSDYGFIEYKINDDQTNARVVIHNILGNPVSEYSLPPYENKVKIRVDALSAGIYFYTLYVDNESVVTRKLIVKK